METKKPIAILGAGMAGLTAANFLKQNKKHFVLYEAGNKIAGLASSFKDAEGFSHDFGAHFVTNRLAKAIGVDSQCRIVKHYGETVWLKGKSYGYPFGLMKIPRIPISFLKTRIQSLNNGHAPNSASDWFSKRYGVSFAQEIALPLVEAWSGVSAEKLSPAAGESLPGSILKTFYLKTASFFTGRAVACGYNREMPERPSVWHVYPNNGVATLCTKLAEGSEDSIKLQSPVTEILVENEKAVAVRVNGELQEVSAVISTAPANILAKLVKGTDALKPFANFQFRPMVFVNLRFQGRDLLPDTVMWFPEKDFPFFRLTEVTRSMPWLAPEGKSIITADIGCQKDDEFWTMDEEKLSALCLDYLSAVIPDVKKRFLGSSILKTPVAYPVFLKTYEKERQDFEQTTHVENLLSIGRNGEFAHRFMEDIYWRTRKKVQCLINSNLKFD
jgi:oxygen-dependent protoporphyrinogen oxidase